MEHLHHHARRLYHIISSPFIYSLIIPVICLDLWVELYHRVCFPLYQLPYIRRRSYIKIDRHKLAYLNTLQKLNCMYCGYVNGVFHYVSTIAAETEKYWCGIQHKKDPQFHPPKHHGNFLPYNNEKRFRDFLQKDR